MSTHPPVDLEEFRAAMRAAGIEEIVEPMLDLFAAEAVKGMAQLAEAIASRDLDATERAAHALKSSAGNVRAKVLAGLLQEVETAAAHGNQPETERLLGLVEAEHASVARYLADRDVNR